jgi:hypothetical protein
VDRRQKELMILSMVPTILLKKAKFEKPLYEPVLGRSLVGNALIPFSVSKFYSYGK